MKAIKLKRFLINLEKRGLNLNLIDVNLKDSFGDYEKAFAIEEDLFDSETNSKLKSICILSK